MIRCIDILTIVAMIVIAGWSLWVRRATWRMPWERHATAATLLSAAGMTIGSSPGIEAVRAVTGYGFGNLVCQLVMMAALGCAIAHSLIRSNLRDRLVVLVRYPIIAGAGLMSLFYALGYSSLKVIAHASTIAYLLGLFAWVLWAFRHDQRSRSISWTIIAVCVVAVVSTATCVLERMHVITGIDFALISGRAAVILFAASFAVSWRKKIKPYKELALAVGARL